MPEVPEWGFSLTFAAVGITIVFASLAIISLVISLIRRANQRWEHREDEAKAAALNKEPTIDSITLVLITAAAATMIQGRFHIRSIRRLMPGGGLRSSWSVQGRAVLHGSHVVTKKR